MAPHSRQRTLSRTVRLGARLAASFPEFESTWRKTPLFGETCGSLRPDRGPRPRHVPRYLRHELVLAAERPFVTEPLPELDDQPLPVEVAIEIEQVRLDPQLLAAVVRVDADRDRRPMTEGGTRVDPVRRDEEIRRRRQVRRGIPERAAALIAQHDRPFDLGRAAEQPSRLDDVP